MNMSEKDEKIVLCVETFIVHKNAVLLRKHDKHKIWLSVGGHIEPHEDPTEAAVREVFEEVGLEVTLFHDDRQPVFNENKRSIIPPQYMLRIPFEGLSDHLTFVYFAKSESDVLKLSEQEACEECRWFTKEELLQNDFGILPNIQFHALRALEKFVE